ncbi:ergosterol biosynthetic protein 28 homolog isoform X1 [Saccopteryx bilineata]|uniref:ergosterol biosynthetic protein 28 homolog isoform X1 n=2 Tax=Saccopteryx bilineata TaxID=59482 RepID=UPI0033901C37
MLRLCSHQLTVGVSKSFCKLKGICPVKKEGAILATSLTLGRMRLSLLLREEPLSDLRVVMSRFLNVLRSWLVMVSIIAMGNTLQSFRDHTFLYEKLYTGKPDLVNGLQARTFGVWTLLSSVIRCLCAIDIHNKTLYHITLWTFLLALGHFLSELFVYGTAAPTVGVLAPLMVASFSILGMLVGLRYLEVEPASRQKKRN